MYDISLSLHRENVSEQMQEWWVVNQIKPGPIPKNPQKAGLDVYVFSDQVSPPSLGFLAGYGYVSAKCLFSLQKCFRFQLLPDAFIAKAGQPESMLGFGANFTGALIDCKLFNPC